MKTLQYTDTVVQTILLVTWLCLAVISGGSWLIGGYFVIGGWQLSSFVMHNYYFTANRFSKARYYYGKTLLVTGIIGILSLGGAIVGAGFLVFWYFYGLLFVSPLMAIGYLLICIKDLNTYDHEK